MMCNVWMDKYEFRRLALRRLVESMGRGSQAKIAKEIEKAPDYISRLLYPEGKSGKKNIGEDTVDLLTEKFPGWLDVDLSDVSENIFTARQKSDREASIRRIVSYLRETESEGISFVLNSAKFAYETYPIAKQTKSYQ